MSENSPEMMEKPDDLTLEECQEAFAMFRVQRKVQQWMEMIMRNPGLWHIRDQIFGHLNNKSVGNCRKVSKLWNESLERMALVRWLEDFGDTEVEIRMKFPERFNFVKVSAIIPGWNNAIKMYGAKASIEDLQETKDSIGKLGDWRFPFHKAVENGALKLMEFFLSTSIDMNARDDHGRTALHVACWNGKTEVTKLLIELSTKNNGIDLKARDNNGRSVLHMACCNGTTEIVKLLIELSTKDDGIDLNARDIYGATALHVAGWNSRTETAKLLIELSTKYEGIDINARDNNGKTPLHWACDCSIGKPEMAKLLIELSAKYGIDINVRDNEGRTPFHWTCWMCIPMGNPETVKFLIESSTKYDIDLNGRDNIGDTALHLACFGVQTETVKIILEHWKVFGIKIKAQNNAGQTALDIVKDNPTWNWNYTELTKAKSMLEEEYAIIDASEGKCRRKT